MNASHQKLSEKLLILNARGSGMLSRLYNIKKACANPASKPQFLSDKNLEPAIKYIQRKFPSLDTKGGGVSCADSFFLFVYKNATNPQSQLHAVNNIKDDIVKSLSLYYYTFVDLLDFRDHVSELLSTFDACQVTLDIVSSRQKSG